MQRLITTEQVSKYHPDKFADQISDAILDECLAIDQNARVAVETLLKDTTCIIAGEITLTEGLTIDYDAVVQRVAKKLNYKIDKIINLIGQQSTQIAFGVDNGGAGDQGMMTGYATRETQSYLPLGFHIANRIIKTIENKIEQEIKICGTSILKGDAKTQVTIDELTNEIDTILISVCHDETFTLKQIRQYIQNLFSEYPTHLLLINPAGRWTKGGPEADCGLTGRKIVCDQYGGYLSVGGGAFSGKDPTKVDRSGAYMARQIAVDIINQFPEYSTAFVQIAYAIGVPQPVSISIYTNNIYNNEITKYVKDKYNLTPQGIIEYLNLKNIKYESLAEGCHYFNNSAPYKFNYFWNKKENPIINKNLSEKHFNNKMIK